MKNRIKTAIAAAGFATLSAFTGLSGAQALDLNIDRPGPGGGNQLTLPAVPSPAPDNGGAFVRPIPIPDSPGVVGGYDNGNGTSGSGMIRTYPNGHFKIDGTIRRSF